MILDHAFKDQGVELIPGRPISCGSCSGDSGKVCLQKRDQHAYQETDGPGWTCTLCFSVIGGAFAAEHHEWHERLQEVLGDLDIAGRTEGLWSL